MGVLLLETFSAGAHAQEMTLAERRLLGIQSKQKALMEDIAEAGSRASADETLQQRAQRLVSEYELFLSRNRENALSRVLFGRWLREIGQDERALEVFLEADKIQADLPVVKQQLGNIMAENGRYQEAVTYFLEAVQLAPQEAVYHYQLGEVLFTYRLHFIQDELLTEEAAEDQTLAAFAMAKRLDKGNRMYRIRYAEAYARTRDADPKKALELWEELRDTALDPLEADTIDLHRAEALLAMNKLGRARAIIENIERPELQSSASRLLDTVRDKMRETE